VTDSSPGGKAEGREARSKRRDAWLIPLIAAVVGAAAAFGFGLIRSPSGTIDVISGSSPAPATTTITPSQGPRQTVTVTASPVPTQPGPVTLPGCPASQGCKGYNLVVRPGDAITFATGAVTPNSAGDVVCQRAGDGALQITPYGPATTYSTDVTPQQANKQGCQALTTSDATTSPISAFPVGLTFCVAINATVIGGLALAGTAHSPGAARGRVARMVRLSVRVAKPRWVFSARMSSLPRWVQV
jgi:hypothetical protein